jgi:hypothetical protein
MSIKFISSLVDELCAHSACALVNDCPIPIIETHPPDHCTDGIDMYDVQAPQPAILDHPVTGVRCVEAVRFALLDTHKEVGLCYVGYLWLIFRPSGMWISVHTSYEYKIKLQSLTLAAVSA